MFADSLESGDEPCQVHTYKDAVAAVNTVKGFLISWENIDNTNFAMVPK